MMKGFAQKLMLILSLLILSIVLLTHFFVLYFETAYENRYREDAKSLFLNCYERLENKLNSIQNMLNSLDGSTNQLLEFDAVEGFVGAGYMIIPNDNTAAQITIGIDGQVQILGAASDIYRGFGELAMFSKRSSEQNQDYFFYGKKVERGIAGYDYMLLVSRLSPLEMFVDYSISNCALINKQGVVVDLLKEDESISGFSDNSLSSEYRTFKNTTYLVSLDKLESAFTEYSLAVLVSKAQITSAVAMVSARFYIFMTACCMLMLLFFVIFLALIRIDKAILATGEHRIDVDISGNIIKTDKILEQRYKKLIGNIKSFVERSFSEESVVIKTERMDGERAYLSCRRFVKKNSTDYIFMATDVTDLYNGYVRFRMEHFTDELTQMDNIQQLEMDFVEKIGTRSRTPLAFIVYELGIEKFWALYGIEFYKKLLKVLADRLSEIYVWQAKSYYLTGDRFVVMASENADGMVEKIDSSIEFISSPVRMDDLIVRTSCNAGYLIYSAGEEELTLTQIISRCELALSYAKSSNKKNNYGYVDSVMRSKQTLSNNDIRQIISSGDVRVCFQPQYSLPKERIVGFEALTRLSGKYSYINPGAFIENVEQSGAMAMLGDYIMDKSMQFAASLDEKDIKISINVSPLQLLGENFVERFLLRMKQYNLEPSQIGVEITETYEMSSIAKAREKLRELQKVGINIGIDDFGEKYSSLRYIKSLPIDFIKIDKGFVDGVEDDKHSRAIVEIIISLAKKLRLYTTVEGVESESQVKILKELGADLIQGYIISPAVEEENAIELIKTKRNLFDREEA